MTKKKPPDSPAFQIVRIVWDEANRTRGHSWMRYNHALHAAVTLGVKGGIPFDVEDFRRFLSEFRGGYWFTEGGLDMWYFAAVVLENIPAARAIERCWGFEPYTIGGKRLYPGNPRYVLEPRRPCHLRDYTGRPEHDGFYVTSLTSDHVNLCRYQDEKGAWQDKPTARMKLSRAEVAALDHAAKQEKKAIEVKRLDGETRAGREARIVKAPYLRNHARLVEFADGSRCLALKHGSMRGRPDWRELPRHEAKRGGVDDKVLTDVYGDKGASDA